MADNFEKLLALVAKKSNGTDKFQLGDETFPTILNIITEKSLIDDFGKGITPNTIGEGSNTYIKNVAGTLADKTGLGGGTTAEAKFGQITISYNAVKVLNEGLAQADMLSGLAGGTTAKLSKFIDQIRKYREETHLAGMITKNIANKVDLSKALYKLGTPTDKKASASAIRQLLIEEATKITKVKDTKQGLHLLNKAKVSIHVAPELFDLIAEHAIIGDRAKETFEGGQYSIGTIGGYDIKANPFIAGDLSQTADTAVAVVGADIA